MGRLLLSGARRFSNVNFHSLQAHPVTHCSIAVNITSRPLQLQSRPAQIISTAGRSLATWPLRAELAKSHKTFATMTFTDQLPAAVQGLTLHQTDERSRFPDCYPSLNPVDIYREHIAEKLGAAAGIEPEKIYTRLNWTNTLDKGDLVLPVSLENVVWCCEEQDG